MSTLIKIGIKDRNGEWQNYMVSVQDKVDQYGNNVSMYVEQTKEEREAKKKRTYVGNGRVVWTDGNIETAPNPNAPEGAGIDIQATAKPETAEPVMAEEKLPTPEDEKSEVADEVTEKSNEPVDDLPF